MTCLLCRLRPTCRLDPRRPDRGRDRPAGSHRRRPETPSGRRRQRFLPLPPLYRFRRSPRCVGTRLDRAPRPPADRLVAWRCAADAAACCVAASLLLEGWTQVRVSSRRSPAVSSPPPPLDRHEAGILAKIDGHTLDHPAMPDAVRLEIPDWLLPQPDCPLRRRAAGRDGGLVRTRFARHAGQPAEGQPRSGPGRAGRRGMGGCADAACPRGACGSTDAARSPAVPPSSPAWSKFRTRAASLSPPWSAPRQACGWWTGAPAPAARPWRWPA